MALKVARMDVWVAEMQDVPGALAGKLGLLAEAKASLAFLLARRSPERPGSGVVFLAPVRGARQVRAAKEAGFYKTDTLHALHVEGADKPGLGAQMTAALAEANINIRGLSAAVIGRRFAAYLALDTADDAAKAARVLRRI
jgi:predicted amino acid-binding ACT domain protein